MSSVDEDPGDRGGERERPELAAFELLLSKCMADAPVAQLRKEADSHGVDVLTLDSGGSDLWRPGLLPHVSGCYAVAEGPKGIAWQLSPSDHLWYMLRREGAHGVDAQGLTIDSVQGH